MTFKKENYTTTLEKAKLLVPGFREAYARMNERMVLELLLKTNFFRSEND